MKRIVAGTLGLTLMLAGSLSARDQPNPDPDKDPYNYDELFSFPPKITLDEKQQAALADLRKSFEPRFAEYWKQKLELDKIPANRNSGYSFIQRQRLIRQATKGKTAILTDDQKKALGVVVVPAFLEEKALSDPNVWDVEQLEKTFEVQSRSFDADEDCVILMVLTRVPWTDAERNTDGVYWSASAVGNAPKVVFYDKHDVAILTFTPNDVGRFTGGLSRAEAKLTEKQAEAGLLRFRIKIDLTLVWDEVKDAASVKVFYPHAKDAPDAKDK